MPKNTGFYQDILFEKEFEGIMPLKLQSIPKEKKVMKLSTLRKMDELQND
jgi:hypothetical protein